MSRKQPQNRFQYKQLLKNNGALGFIAGLITGLVIAIIIAMIITRTPMPFNSKHNAQGKSLSEAPTPFSDPNQPMYGNRDAAKEAYKNAASAAETQAQSSTESEKATTYLQAGAYREKNDAENMRAKLALIGIEARIKEVTSQNGNLYRVHLGPYNPSTLASTQSKLKENGIDFTTSRAQ